MTRPQLQIADLVPAEAFPRRQIDQGKVRMEGNQVYYEQLEEYVDNESNPTEHTADPQGQEHRHHQLGLLEPEVRVKVASVALTDRARPPFDESRAP